MNIDQNCHRSAVCRCTDNGSLALMKKEEKKETADLLSGRIGE